MQKDWIEDTIANIIYNFCLTDDNIEVIAEETVKYNAKRLKESNVGLLEEELEDVNTRIGNLMKAMEAGAMSRNTVARLHELEDEQMKLNIRLSDAKVNIVSCSKEQLVTGMRLFRKGDITNKKVQAKLFDTFLQAAFLYDKKLTLVFNFTGTRNRIEVPIENLIDDDLIDVIKSEADIKEVLKSEVDMIRPKEKKGHQSDSFIVICYILRDASWLLASSFCMTLCFCGSSLSSIKKSYKSSALLRRRKHRAALSKKSRPACSFASRACVHSIVAKTIA